MMRSILLKKIETQELNGLVHVYVALWVKLSSQRGLANKFQVEATNLVDDIQGI